MGLYRTGKEYAEQAKNSKYDKLKYADCDCQAFCELVLKDLGIRTDKGTAYNWKGSNDMARHAVSWIGTREECIKKFGYIPLGAWAFIWENKTGKERERGYTDGLGNFSHIGIVVSDSIVRDSTRYKDSEGNPIRDGVADRSISAFNRFGICKLLDFGAIAEYNDKGSRSIITEIRAKLDELEGMLL